MNVILATLYYLDEAPVVGVGFTNEEAEEDAKAHFVDKPRKVIEARLKSGDAKFTYEDRSLTTTELEPEQRDEVLADFEKDLTALIDEIRQRLREQTLDMVAQRRRHGEIPGDPKRTELALMVVQVMAMVTACAHILGELDGHKALANPLHDLVRNRLAEALAALELEIEGPEKADGDSA